jgi:hypothetical protein
VLRTAIAVSFLTFAALGSACDGDSASDATPEATATSSADLSPTPLPPEPTIVATTATVRLLPPAGTIPTGTTFTVIVRIIGATNLGAYQIEPSYDPAILELVKITDSGFLGSTGRLPTCGQDPSAPSPFYCVTFGQDVAGPSGDGDLALLEFRALTAGNSEVAMQKIVVTMPDARDVPIVIEPAQLTVQ